MHEPHLKLGLHEAKILLVVTLADNRCVLNALRLDVILQSQIRCGALMDLLQGILVHIPTNKYQPNVSGCCLHGARGMLSTSCSTSSKQQTQAMYTKPKDS